MQDGNQHQIQTDVNSSLAELQKQLMQLKDAVTYIDKAKNVTETSIKALEWLKKLEESYKKLLPHLEKLIKDIKAIDFPTRLGSIDTKLTTVVNEVNYIKSIIDSSKKEILKSISSGTSTIIKNINDHFLETDISIQSIENFLNKSSKEFKLLHQLELKQIKFNKVINITTLILVLAILFFIILQYFSK